MAHISVVSPVYACKTSLIELYVRLKETLEKITLDFEIIFVNDASPDGAWETIIELTQKDKRVKGIDLSRNFGQHYAITAGLDYAKGEWVVVMDCDLQDQPEEIIKLYDKAKEGYDVVLGRRISRNDNFYKKALSSFFYKLFNYLTDIQFDPTVGSFRILSKKVVDSYNKLNEKLIFFGALINWLGFKTAFVDIKHTSRKSGRSSYSFSKKLKLAINAILSFSDKPLRITIKIGVFMSFATFIFILYKVFINLLYGTSAIGWSSIIAAIGFSTGLIISVIGVLGLYIGGIFKEVKNRPTYIYSDKINLD